MKLQCLFGERVIEFDLHKRGDRGVQYKFVCAERDSNRRGIGPAVCEVTNEKHIGTMLAQSHKFILFEPDDETIAKANAILADELRRRGPSQETVAENLPFLSIAELGEPVTRVRLELPTAAWNLVQAGTHTIDVVERDADDLPDEPPVLQVAESVRDVIDTGTRAQLLAYCQQNSIKHNFRKDDDAKLRRLIREHALAKGGQVPAIAADDTEAAAA